MTGRSYPPPDASEQEPGVFAACVAYSTLLRLSCGELSEEGVLDLTHEVLVRVLRTPAFRHMAAQAEAPPAQPASKSAFSGREEAYARIRMYVRRAARNLYAKRTGLRDRPHAVSLEDCEVEPPAPWGGPLCDVEDSFRRLVGLMREEGGILEAIAACWEDGITQQAEIARRTGYSRWRISRALKRLPAKPAVARLREAWGGCAPQEKSEKSAHIEGRKRI